MDEEKEETLKRRNEKLYQSSTQVSNIIRQLIFAGIAIVWLFRVKDKNNNIVLDIRLIWSLLLFSSAIFIELMHYLIGTVTQKIFTNNEMLDKTFPIWIVRLTWILWLMKIILTIVAYVLIGLYIVPMVTK